MGKIMADQFVVAIGSSIGGGEAISSFFNHEPIEGVSYVLIQYHLSPDFKDQISDMLPGQNKMEIIEVRENTLLEANKIYLLPDNKSVRLKNGELQLSEKSTSSLSEMTIDTFLISIADEMGSKSIAVILSGSGHDGSRGIEHIKKAGGMVIVQDPATAKFVGMPYAAIATGFADYILPPISIPAEIEKLVKNIAGPVTVENFEDIRDRDILSDIIELIKTQMPVDFTDYKRATILRRIKRRMFYHNLSWIDEYYNFLQNNEGELEVLVNEFLIGVTSFFRDSEAFEALKQKIIPSIIENHPNEMPLKIWVAGCATGEEAYSIGILVKEYLLETNKELDVKIFATDINKPVLERASKGVFSENINSIVSEDRLHRFFSKIESGYKINPEIRNMIVFAHHDLAKNPPYCNMDLISCRNLLIYMNPKLQNKIYSLLNFGLKKGGYLFLGPNESVSFLEKDFLVIDQRWKIFQSVKSRQSFKFESLIPPIIENPKVTYPALNNPNNLVVPKPVFAEEISAAILEESGFCGVFIDEYMMIQQSFGDLTPFFKQENVSLNLMDILPDTLAPAFATAMHDALKLNHRATFKNIKWMDPAKETIHIVNVVIRPLTVIKADPKLILVLFKEEKDFGIRLNNEETFDIDRNTNEYIANLEDSLMSAKTNLHIAYEMLESNNENLQSFNEELLSANKELENANEELTKINTEYAASIKELAELNDDLSNYFRSNINGQLIVDTHLFLRKYSPGAVKYIHIQSTDIGKSITGISSNIDFEILINDLHQVISNGEVIIKEVESYEHKFYQVMMIPYLRQVNNKPDGAIITFYDITSLKSIQKELSSSNKSLLRINADLDNFVQTTSQYLNNAIFNLESRLGVLADKIDPGDAGTVELSQLINAAIESFKKVLTDLSVIGKIETEILSESYSENFVDLFDEISFNSSDQIAGSKEVFISDFQDKNILLHKKNLRSIMFNLIRNALKSKSDE